MKNVKIYHVKDENGDTVSTVATMIMPDTDGSGVKGLQVGFAFVSPKDKFERKMGRMVALDRMVSDQKSYTTTFSGHSSSDIAKIWPAVNKPSFLQNTEMSNDQNNGLVVQYV